MDDHRILVVDDDDSIRRLLVDFFQQLAPLQVDWARDGAEALHFLSSRSYAAVVLDVMMPHMSGIDLLASLQAMTADPTSKIHDVPAIFMITAAAQEDVPSDTIEGRFPSMVRRVFRKPLDVRSLADEVVATVGPSR